jgi:hypothetical protein
MLCSKKYNKKFILHLIVALRLSSGWQHKPNLTKTRPAVWADEQSMYTPMSMDSTDVYSNMCYLLVKT